MTIYDFAKLNPSEKEELLKQKGAFIDEYKESDNHVTIYKLKDFIVEVAANKTKVEIIPFKN